MGIASKLARTMARKVASRPTKSKKPRVSSKKNTTSIFKKQSAAQAATQKATQGQRRYKVGRAKGFVGGVGATSVIGAAAAIALYKKDALFATKLEAAKNKGQTVVKHNGETYKVPARLPALPLKKPKMYTSERDKKKKLTAKARLKEIDSVKAQEMMRKLIKGRN